MRTGHTLTQGENVCGLVLPRMHMKQRSGRYMHNAKVRGLRELALSATIVTAQVCIFEGWPQVLGPLLSTNILRATCRSAWGLQRLAAHVHAGLVLANPDAPGRSLI